MDSIGVVIRIKGKKSIVVCETGTFEVIKTRDGMFVGQKVLYSQEDIVAMRESTVRYLYPVIAGIAAVLVLMLSYFNFLSQDDAFAYIDVDINPSVEFVVDREGIILKAVPLNEDARNIMGQLTYKDMLLKDVILDLITISKDYGYIKKDQKKDIVLISAAIKDGESIENEYAIKDRLINGLRTDIERLNIDIDMRFVEVSSDLRKKAQENKVSMGKYLIYEKAKQEGKEISIEILNKSTLVDLLTENNMGLDDTNIPAPGMKPLASNTPYETGVIPVYTPASTMSDIGAATATPSGSPMPTSTKILGTPALTAIPTKMRGTPTPTSAQTKIPDAPALTPAPAPTATPIPVTRIPTSSPTNIPVVHTPTHTTAPDGVQNIKVQFFNDNATSKTSATYLRINIVNTGEEPVDLSDLKLRYYYTIDGYSDQTFSCDWSPVGKENVTGRFVKMSSPSQGADTYVEIGFTNNAGRLEPGKGINVNARYSKTDWTQYDQSNDYSFNSVTNNYKDWDKITAYISGVLKWGREP